MREQCDASYKLMFSLPSVVRDLVTGFIADDWLHGLDFATLEKVPCSYVSDDLRKRADDVVWRVMADGEWAYLYLLIEFQSTVDTYMAVRIKTYAGLLHQDLIRGGNVLPGRKLPPILPIVLYNGDATWTATTDIAEMIPTVPGLVQRYAPRQSYLLIDQSQYNDDDLAAKHNLVACMIRFERASSIAVMSEVIDRLDKWLKDEAESRRAFALWMAAVVSRRSGHTLVLPQIEDLKELNMTLTQRFDEWKEQYKREGWQRGRQEGRQEGEAMLLQKMLTRRFGSLPPELVSRIASSPAEQIDVWAERLLRAQTLQEIFES